ncbi:hypothetical protein V039C_0042 [Vibrio phage V039C]|nr:hypothetical protein V039C_0042 [Vibrio phage V039C]
MITCKQDLINTYIENDNGELRDLYIKKAIDLGVKTCDGGRFEYLLDKVTIGVRDWGYGAQLEWNNREFSDAKHITLSDLKPRTKVEYEKVTDSIFDLKDEFESGLLFTKKFNQEWHQIKTEEQLGNLLSMNDDPTKNGIYRKVERPVEWWEDAVEYIRSLNGEANPVRMKDEHGDNEIATLNFSVVLSEREARDLARILLEQEDENKNNASS